MSGGLVSGFDDLKNIKFYTTEHKKDVFFLSSFFIVFLSNLIFIDLDTVIAGNWSSKSRFVDFAR